MKDKKGTISIIEKDGTIKSQGIKDAVSDAKRHGIDLGDLSKIIKPLCKTEKIRKSA